MNAKINNIDEKNKYNVNQLKGIICGIESYQNFDNFSLTF